MKKLLVIFCTTLLFVCTFIPVSNAQKLKSTYEQLGFMEGIGAVEQFEQANNTKVSLPKKQPPHDYTHIYSRFKNYQGIINDKLEIIYKFDLKEKGMYVISISHKEATIPFVKNNRKKMYTLENGTTAYYFHDTVKHFQMLVFQHDDYQYIIGCNEAAHNGIKTNELIDIANSI